MTRVRKAIWMTGLALLILILLAPVLVDRFPGGTLYWETLFGFGHVLIFGVVALVLLRMALILWQGSGGNRWFFYLFALMGTFVLTVLSELMQFYGPRDASMFDLVSDLAGGISALGLAASFDPHLTQSGLLAVPRRRWQLRTASILLICLFLIPFAVMFNDYRQRQQGFPSICRFESAWEMKFVGNTGSLLEITQAPQAWDRAAGGKAGRITFVDKGYPRMAITEPFPDWTGYRFFAFDLYSEMEQPVNLTLRVDDRDHDESFDDRFNRRFEFGPGAHQVRIPLEEIRSAPQEREMQMESMRWIVFYTVDPAEPYSLWIDNIRLE